MAGDAMPSGDARVVVTEPAEAEALAQWAAVFTRRRPMRLKLLCLSSPPANAIDRMNPHAWAPPRSVDESGDPAVPAAGLETEVLSSALGHRRDPVRAVLDRLSQGDVGLLVIAYNGRRPPRSPEHRPPDRLLRFAPCDVLVIDPGASEHGSAEQVLVPVHGADWITALHAAIDIVEDHGSVFALRASARFGPDAEAVARKELEHELRVANHPASARVSPVVQIGMDAFAETMAGCQAQKCGLARIAHQSGRSIGLDGGVAPFQPRALRKRRIGCCRDLTRSVPRRSERHCSAFWGAIVSARP